MEPESSALRRLRRVSATEARLLLEAQLTLVTCQLAHWFRPAGKLVSPARSAGSAGYDASARQVAPAIGWAVSRAARYGCFRPQCLVRSLAVQKMLRRRGSGGGVVRIGVRREGGNFVAHAWVELDGVVVGDSPEHIRTFTPAPDIRLVGL